MAGDEVGLPAANDGLVVAVGAGDGAGVHPGRIDEIGGRTGDRLGDLQARRHAGDRVGDTEVDGLSVDEHDVGRLVAWAPPRRTSRRPGRPDRECPRRSSRWTRPAPASAAVNSVTVAPAVTSKRPLMSAASASEQDHAPANTAVGFTPWAGSMTALVTVSPPYRRCTEFLTANGTAAGPLTVTASPSTGASMRTRRSSVAVPTACPRVTVQTEPMRNGVLDRRRATRGTGDRSRCR